MVARFSLRSLAGLSLLLSLVLFYAPAANAVRRPGAPRPLRVDDGSLMLGIDPMANEDGLVYFNEPGPQAEAAREYFRAVSLDKTGVKNSWRVTPMAVPPAESLQSYSPDGQRCAFVSRQEAVYVQDLRDKSSAPRRVAIPARNPCWLDDETLLFESGRAGRPGLYIVSVPRREPEQPPAPQLFFEKSGEAAVSANGKLICVAARESFKQDSQLYLLARDGSGAKAIPLTSGARRPSFSPSGSAIYYDAPTPRDGDSPASPARVIWMLPMVNVPPAAQVMGVKLSKEGDVDVLATAFSAANGGLDVKLELGEGEEPENWKQLETRPAPIHSGVLASLHPGGWRTDSSWTLRLTVVDSDGDRAQSLLTFDWPLRNTSDTPVILPPLFGTDPAKYGLDPAAPAKPALPELPVPQRTPDPAPVTTPVPSVPPAPHVKPEPVAAPDTDTPVPAIAALPRPALVPRPTVRPVVTEKTKPAQSPRTVAAIPPAQVPAIKSAPPAVKMAEIPVRQPKPVIKPVARIAPPLNPQAQVAADEIMTEAVPASQAPTKMAEKASGIPSQMKAGGTVPVTVVLRNTGSRAWSSHGDSPVRLVYRWVDSQTNTRHWWAIRWLREEVPPGKTTRLKFDLSAPRRPGNYVLTYALVRLSPAVYDGKNYKPPASNAKDHRWPGEFGAVSFRIAVTK